MRLRLLQDQVFTVPGIDLVVEFAEGEDMRTEVPAQFRQAGIAAELAATGFVMRSWWTGSARPVRPVAVSPCLRARSRTRPRSATSEG